MIVISKNVILLSNLWYNCDKQEYHNFAPYKRLYIGSLWHKYSKYECQSIVRRKNFQLKKAFICASSPSNSQDNKIISRAHLSNICKYIPN